MTGMKRFSAICGLAFVVALAATGMAASKTFVSLSGKFLIKYPDNWRQVGFGEVDMVLSMSNARNENYRYEAVFAPDSNPQFQIGPYAILKIDTVGQYSQKQIDSAAAQLGTSFGGTVKKVSAAELLTRPTENSPEYAAEIQTVAVMSTLNDEEKKSGKVSLLAMRFYNRGIANLYFYAPQAQFERCKPIFKSIIESFSTENLEEAMPKENLKVASAEKMRGSSETAAPESSGSRLWVVLVGLALVVAIAFGVSRMRNRATH